MARRSAGGRGMLPMGSVGIMGWRSCARSFSPPSCASAVGARLHAVELRGVEVAIVAGGGIPERYRHVPARLGALAERVVRRGEPVMELVVVGVALDFLGEEVA